MAVTFKNASGSDLEVIIDGHASRPVLVAANDTFQVPDEFADRLRSQSIFKEIKSKPEGGK